MMVSGAVAVTISALSRGQRRTGLAFGFLTAVLLYALLDNIIEQPDGIMISAFFIAGIITVSLISRVARTTERRVEQVEFDDTARAFIRDSLAFDGALNLIANKRAIGDRTEYADKELEQRGMNLVPGAADLLFLEIAVVARERKRPGTETRNPCGRRLRPSTNWQ